MSEERQISWVNDERTGKFGLSVVKLTYNAQPVLLKNSTGSRPQGQVADYTPKWFP